MIRNKGSLKNITIIASTEFPYNSASANLIRNLGLGLSSYGKRVNLLISRGSEDNRLAPRKNRINYHKGIKYTYCSFISKPKNYLLRIFDILISMFTIPAIIIIRKINSNIDAVIIYTGYAYQNFPVLLTCLILNVPIYKYSVDWYNKDSIVHKWWMLPKWWMFIFELSFLDRFLNGIIVISFLLKDHYLKIGISDKKLIIIPNLIDLELFNTEKKNLVNIKGIENVIRIGYVGAAPLLNGVDDLIKAFAYVHDIYNNSELLIVGDVSGDKTQLPLLMEVAIDCGVSEIIKFTGRVHSEEIPDYLASCNILVMARKSTQFAQAGFPTKLGEYFASKKPVVMTGVGDISEYFTNKEQLVIAEPDNPISLCDSIVYLLENPSKAKEIAEKGYQWAKENLDYLKTTSKIYDFMARN